jgi:CheY-like chemotaxis protein
MAEKVRGSVRIALAEDEPDLRLAVSKLLERLGHQVVSAVANGAELLDACATHDVDLVVADLDMPVMDGLTAAEELTDRGIPVVIVSGHPDARELVLENEPVVTRILKPATLETLQGAIEEALSDKH